MEFALKSARQQIHDLWLLNKVLSQLSMFAQRADIIKLNE